MTKAKNTKVKKGFNTYNIIYLCFLFVLISLSLFNFSLYINSKPKETLAVSSKNKEEQQISFWNTFLEQHPDYFDGWVELAKLEIASGNFKEASIAFRNAKEINPNSELLNDIEEYLLSVNK